MSEINIKQETKEFIRDLEKNLEKLKSKFNSDNFFDNLPEFMKLCKNISVDANITLSELKEEQNKLSKEYEGVEPEEFKFSSSNEALQHLANITGKKIKVAKITHPNMNVFFDEYIQEKIKSGITANQIIEELKQEKDKILDMLIQKGAEPQDTESWWKRKNRKESWKNLVKDIEKTIGTN